MNAHPQQPRPVWLFTLLACLLAIAPFFTYNPLLASGAFTTTGQIEAPAASVCPATGSLEGVDVSNFSGTVNWVTVAKTKAFAYARVADGASFIDPNFQTNFTAIKSAGMKAGGYLFFEPTQDAAMQASVMSAQLTKAGFAFGDLIPMIDVEITGTQSSQTLATELQTLVNSLKSSLNVTPGIITGGAFWDSKIASTAFSDVPLWVTHFNVACPTLPAAWNNWALWGYSDNGTVSGIAGPVDLDRTNGPSLPVSAFTLNRVRLPFITK